MGKSTVANRPGRESLRDRDRRMKIIKVISG